MAAGPERAQAVGALPVQLTKYVGRQAETEQIRRLLGTARLVTLTGPGGVGKTRLAVRVAELARASFPDGVVFIGLAELTDPALLVSTVSTNLGLGNRSARPALELLVEQLRRRRVLVVLDNCEHVIDACRDLVSEVLAGCPHVVLLATSRQSLSVAGEHIFVVPALTGPGADDTVEAIERCDAVRLFLDRAAEVRPGLTVTADNAADVVRVCQALDGLPLAIELAAVLLRSLAIGQLADRLNERFTLLTVGSHSRPSRHETLRTVLDWSYDLCTDAERLLWARAAVFAGSFDLDAAEAVCAGDGLDRATVLDTIDGLLDKSILARDEEADGIARYRMLETVRHYGQERLSVTGDLTRTRRRHRDHYLGLCTRFDQEWFGPHQAAWFERLRRDHANIAAGLDFCTTASADASAGIQMIADTWEYWFRRGLLAEGRHRLAMLLGSAPPDAPARGDALWVVAFFAVMQNDLDGYQGFLDEATEIAVRTGDRRIKGYTDVVRGHVATLDNDMPTSAEWFERAAREFRAADLEYDEAWALRGQGMAVGIAGDVERGRRILDDVIKRMEAHDDVFQRAYAVFSRATVELWRGDPAMGLEYCKAALRLQRADQMLVAFALSVASGCLIRMGEMRRGVRVYGAGGSVWRLTGTPALTHAVFESALDREAVVAALGAEEAVEELKLGGSWSIDEAIAAVLGEEPEPAEVEPAPEPTRPNPLTKRQTEIAGLVAEGLTNREIADRLVISKRTADTHVEQILGKLGFHNRAQIASWVTRTRTAG